MKKKIIIILIMIFNMMDAQKDLSKNYEVITFEESLKYDVGQMTEYKYSDFNQSTSLFINDNKLIVFPNLNDGRCLIIAKQDYDEMFSNNSFPVLPENNTPYFIYRELLNMENFTREKMVEILFNLGTKFDDRTFYDDLEKFSNTLSNNDKKKYLSQCYIY
ncbi:hypothetical protein OMO38_19205 [Chryseobacterium sp. 09-1422]|uniref:DUF4476 domain-containing protein n=1 Tax=Chryseobacterium kimseyorum TaxID=2984028 RepID=A0ABT3I4A0_9FLAO|nr:hypothetical protein [Chryseobacterium kimseyorum]MCW3170663.1 hypothetical protein [Chryseobacterium kimseyorum]